MAYRMIRGRPLWRETLQLLDESTLVSLVDQLVTFLWRLHELPACVLATKSADLDSRERWADLYALVRAQLFHYMRPNARLALAEHFESFIDQPDHFAYEVVIRHGDPGPGNVLFDPESNQISGVIDFDFAGVGDSAVDWSVVLCPRLYGEAFVRRIQTEYPIAEPVLSRARFYRGTWAVREALRAQECGQEDAFAIAMADYW